MIFQRKSPKINVLLGEKSSVKGDITSEGTLLIQGWVTGNIEGEQVIIDKNAAIDGDILAARVSIAGRVIGQITGKEGVEIKSTGYVKGDITTPRLAMEEGAYFRGFCGMEEAATTDGLPDKIPPH